MGLLDFAVKTFYKAADPLITAIAHPFKTADAIFDKNKSVKEVSNEFFSQTKSQQIAQTLISGANAELALVGVGAGGNLGTKIVTSLIPKSIGGKIIAGGSLLAVEGAVARKPEETIEVGQKTIAGLPNFGGNVAEFVGDPSIAQAQKTFTDNPVLTSGIVLGGLAAGTFGLNSLLNTIATAKNTKAINEVKRETGKEPDYGDQKNLIQEQAQQERKNIEAQTQAQIQLSELQFKQQKELAALQTPAVAPSPEVVAPRGKKKKKKKTKKKAKKKTRRSKKKSKKGKKKSIKRRIT